MRLVEAKKIVLTNVDRHHAEIDLSQFESYRGDEGDFSEAEWVLWLKSSCYPDIFFENYLGEKFDRYLFRPLGQPSSSSGSPYYPNPNNYTPSTYGLDTSTLTYNLLRFPAGKQHKILLTKRYRFAFDNGMWWGSGRWVLNTSQLDDLVETWMDNNPLGPVEAWGCLFRASKAELGYSTQNVKIDTFTVSTGNSSLEYYPEPRSPKEDHNVTYGGHLREVDIGYGGYWGEGYSPREVKSIPDSASIKRLFFLNWSLQDGPLKFYDHRTQGSNVRVVSEGGDFVYLEATIYRDGRSPNYYFWSNKPSVKVLCSGPTTTNKVALAYKTYFDMDEKVGDVLHSYIIGDKLVRLTQIEPWKPKMDAIVNLTMNGARTWGYPYVNPLMPSVSKTVEDAPKNGIFVVKSSVEEVSEGVVRIKAEFNLPARMIVIIKAGNRNGRDLFAKKFDKISNRHDVTVDLFYKGLAYVVVEASSEDTQ